MIDFPSDLKKGAAVKFVELQFGSPVVIENPRNYPADQVEQLRKLLQAGTLARPDRGRSGVYEAENDAYVFYIHVSPVSRTVTLMAAWAKAMAA